jgi:hypothetical protein
MRTDVSRKLQKIIADIDANGHANLTRLTVLKRWLERPSRLSSFGLFIASEASRRKEKTTKKAAQLLCEAREILADVDIFNPKSSRRGAIRLHARLSEFQNERRQLDWTSVRNIHNWNLFLIESGLGLYLWHVDSPTRGYRLAASYCQHYEPRYGSGLLRASITRIQVIAHFTLAIEAHEEARSPTFRRA